MAKKDQVFSELVNRQPLEIKDWIISIDKLLTESGCKAAVDNKGTLTYTSKASKNIVCKILMGESGCSLRPYASHLTDENNILPQLPDTMLDYMKSGKECGICAERNPSFVQCRHGGPFKFTHNNRSFARCRFYPFEFLLDNAPQRDLLKKWIEMELTHNRG